MLEPKFIKADNYNTKSQRYDELLKEGIEWIQRFSGNQWTDYNFHDPGITILEQLCFALTDLGYKTNFPFEDLIFIGRDKFNLEEQNLFYPLHKILPSNPLTANDYRKLILDKIKNIQNAWIFPEKDNLQNIAGLHHVKVQLNDNLSPEQIQKTLKDVDEIIMEHRALCTDFYPTTSLKKNEIKFHGDLTLDSFAVGEEVLAKIYIKIEESISNKPKFYDYDELEETGYDVLELYAGTLTQKGFLKDVDFSEKTNEIYVSELKEIIYSVEGVQAIENLVFYKDGIQVFDDYISFEKDAYPSLISLEDTFFDNELEGIQFYRNDSFYKIDKIIFQQIYDALAVAEKEIHQQTFSNPLDNLRGRFDQQDFEHYYSIMRELPSIYGLREDELPSKSSDLRRAQANQLRAYLLIFDQFMANHISQVTNIRNLFSVDISKSKTQFNQIPTDVPELEAIVGTDLEKYQIYLDEHVETRNEFFERKNLILDHLLARFGESFDTSLLGKIHALNNDDLSNLEVKKYCLDIKINYAKALLELGYSRVKAFDYTKNRANDSNLSGIEKRLKLKLGIQKNISESTVYFFSEKAHLIESEEVWRKKILSIDNGPELEVLSLPKNSYDNENIRFYLNKVDAFKYLFLNGSKLKNYTIVKSNNRYILLFKGIEGQPPALLCKANSEDECLEKKRKAIQKIKEFNTLSEGFYMIENILLRPTSQKKFTHYILDKNKKRLLQSYYDASNEIDRELLGDFYILAVDKKNYNVVKKPSTNKYEIVLYGLLNKPLFKSVNTFNKEDLAKEAIPLMIQFFKNQLVENQMEGFTEVVAINDLSNKFPNEFNYTNRLNFIIPDWPSRFQNKELKNYITQLLQENIPAHLHFEVYYLSINQMSQFEAAYTKWISCKQSGNSMELDSTSLQIIQMLLSYKKNEK